MLSKNEYLSQPSLRSKSKTERERLWRKYNAKHPKPRNTARTPARNLRLSPTDKCVVDYAAALVDPFTQPPTCLPVAPSLESQKYACFVRGNFYAGTSNGGFGYVALAPKPVNDFSSPNQAVWASTSAFTLQAVNSSSNANVDGMNPNSPFTNPELYGNSGDISVRITAAGIRARYTGTELNRSGSMVAFEQPDHHSVVGLTYEDVLAYKSAVVTPVSREWTVVTYQPKRDDEFKFLDSVNSGSVSNHQMVIMVNGLTAGESLEFEAFIHFEAIGSTIRGKTPSHAATDTTHSVLSMLGQAPTTLFDRISNEETARDVATVATSLAKNGISYASDQLFTAASNYLSRGASKMALAVL